MFSNNICSIPQLQKGYQKGVADNSHLLDTRLVCRCIATRASSQPKCLSTHNYHQLCMHWCCMENEMCKTAVSNCISHILYVTINMYQGKKLEQNQLRTGQRHTHTHISTTYLNLRLRIYMGSCSSSLFHWATQIGSCEAIMYRTDDDTAAQGVTYTLPPMVCQPAKRTNGVVILARDGL